MAMDGGTLTCTPTKFPALWAEELYETAASKRRKMENLTTCPDGKLTKPNGLVRRNAIYNRPVVTVIEVLSNSFSELLADLPKKEEIDAILKLNTLTIAERRTIEAFDLSKKDWDMAYNVTLVCPEGDQPDFENENAINAFDVLRQHLLLYRSLSLLKESPSHAEIEGMVPELSRVAKENYTKLCDVHGFWRDSDYWENAVKNWPEMENNPKTDIATFSIYTSAMCFLLKNRMHKDNCFIDEETSTDGNHSSDETEPSDQKSQSWERDAPYWTPVTNPVLGRLTDKDVSELDKCIDSEFAEEEDRANARIIVNNMGLCADAVNMYIDSDSAAQDPNLVECVSYKVGRMIFQMRKKS